jgi:hypothetical protein
VVGSTKLTTLPPLVFSQPPQNLLRMKVGTTLGKNVIMYLVNRIARSVEWNTKNYIGGRSVMAQGRCRGT